MSKFKVGDRVRIIRDGVTSSARPHEIPLGTIVEITEGPDKDGDYAVDHPYRYEGTPYVHPEFMELLSESARQDPVVASVKADYDARSEVGIKKYNATLDRPDVGLLGWLKHAYEESLDHSLYLKCAILKLEGNQTHGS